MRCESSGCGVREEGAAHLRGVAGHMRSKDVFIRVAQPHELRISLLAECGDDREANCAAWAVLASASQPRSPSLAIALSHCWQRRCC